MHLKSSCSFLIHLENKVWSVSVDIRSPTFSMLFRHNDNDHMSFMTRNQKWFHLELVFFFLKTYSHTIHSVILCIIISGNCRWQPSVNTNTHNGVKFPSQIIETIFNALNATIYSTTLLHETKYQSWIERRAIPHIHDNDLVAHLTLNFWFLALHLRLLLLPPNDKKILFPTDFRFNIHAHAPWIDCRVIVIVRSTVLLGGIIRSIMLLSKSVDHSPFSFMNSYKNNWSAVYLSDL